MTRGTALLLAALLACGAFFCATGEPMWTVVAAACVFAWGAAGAPAAATQPPGDAS